MTFDKNIAGKRYTGSVDSVALYDLRQDGYFAGTNMDAGNDYYVTVTLTGWQARSVRGSVGCQTTTGEYVILSEGWQPAGTGAQYSQRSAQQLVDQIIRNNQTIIANNLLCARFSYKLTKDQLAQVRELQQRLQDRNAALIDGRLCTDLAQSYPSGYADLQPYLDRVMSGTAQSIGSVTVAIIVTAVVIASLSTAAYFAYKAYAAQSEQDVKYSKDLTKILTEKLTEDEYNMLLQETKGIVTKARIRQSLSSYGKIATLAMVGVGAYFIYKIIKDRL